MRGRQLLANRVSIGCSGIDKQYAVLLQIGRVPTIDAFLIIGAVQVHYDVDGHRRLNIKYSTTERG